MKYNIYARRKWSRYAKLMVLLSLLIFGLLVYDFLEFWRFMLYVFTGVK